MCLFREGPGLWDGPNAWIFVCAVENQPCPSNSTIGGYVVVFSALIASSITTLASVAAAVIDSWLGVSTIVPQPLREWARRDLSPKAIQRYQTWRKILGLVVCILADTQALVGFTMLISAFINLRQQHDPTASLLDFQDAYMTLSVYLSCLASCSHLASLLVMRDYIDRHRTATTLRIIVIVLFGTLLTVTIDLSEYAFLPLFLVMEKVLINIMRLPKSVEYNLEYAAPPIVMFYIFWISVAQLVKPLRTRVQSLWPKVRPFTIGWALDWLKDDKRLGEARYTRIKSPLKAIGNFLVFSHPIIVFLLQVLFAIVSLTFTLLLRFTPALAIRPKDCALGITQWCSLANRQDDGWSFGQTSAMILLVIPMYSTIQAYFESSHDSIADANINLETNAPLCASY